MDLDFAPGPRATGRWLIIVNLGVAAMLVAVAAVALHASHEAYSSRARDATENLAGSLGNAIASELTQVDNALQSAAFALRRVDETQPEAGEAIEQLLAKQKSLLPGIDSLRIGDADGIVRHGPGVAARPGISLYEREFFRRVRDAGDDRLMVSEPLQSRISHTWVIVMARRLQNSDNSYRGIVYANLGTEHFQRMFSQIALGTEGAISLRTDSLRLVARYTPGDASPPPIGTSTVSPALAAAVQSDPLQGFIVTRTALDGVERTSAYRRVGAYPLLILVGLGTDDFFTPWRDQLKQVVALVAIVVLLAALVSVLVYRNALNRRRVEARVTQLLREQAVMLDNELVGMVKLRDRVATWKNKALDRIFGYAHEELVGQPSRMLYLDDASYAAIGTAAYDVLRRGGIYRTQLQMRRKDGSGVWIDLSGTQVGAQESLWMMLDITALKQHEERVEHIAFHDPLTGLANRHLLGDRLDQALRAAARTGRCVAVAYVDLDGFKQVNDHHGHLAGDELLREIGQRFSASVRGNDTAARIGGDEFVIVLTDLSDVAEAHEALQRLLRALKAPIVLSGGAQVSVGASIGVALCPGHGKEAPVLLARADGALFEAKRAGKNCIRVHGSDDAAQVAAQNRLFP